jgi:hypothetical protein
MHCEHGVRPASAFSENEEKAGRPGLRQSRQRMFETRRESFVFHHQTNLGHATILKVVNIDQITRRGISPRRLEQGLLWQGRLALPEESKISYKSNVILF